MYPFCRKYNYFNFYCNVLVRFYTFDVKSKLQQVAIDNIDDHTRLHSTTHIKDCPLKLVF